MPEAPEFSIIVPAYNEEAELPRALDALRAAIESTGRAGELVVVDNNSTDATARIAREAGARVVFEPKNQISRARNAGARATQAPYLIFVDADTVIEPELLEAALANLDSGGCCGGGALVAFDAPLSRTARLGVKLWNRLATRRRLAAGAFVYVTREAFEGVGGFSERVYAGEELFFSRAMRRWGRKRGQEFRIIPEPRIVTSSRKLRDCSPARLLLQLALTFVPFFILFRPLCGFWYRRR